MSTKPIVCTVHKYHYPTPLRIVLHHILPQAMGGKTEQSNLVAVCDTGHYNVHRLLGYLLNGSRLKGGTRTERALAKQGYAGWTALGKPGKPVYEVW